MFGSPPGNRLLRCCGLCLLLLCSGCLTQEKISPLKHDDVIVLLDPDQELGESWEHRRLRRGNTTYERVNSPLGNTIQATGNLSASILFRLFEPIQPECNELRWSWYVSRPQPGSDLHIRGMDDVAASVFILFGDPGLFRDKTVPTIKYAWANDRHRTGEIIAGPYHEKFVRTRVVRTGDAPGEQLVMERVNLADDYLEAFGEMPKDGIHGVAIFTDNDDTEEPITAHYGRIELSCKTSG